MPQRRELSRDVSADIAARIVTGPDPDRFYCPHAGCNRSFAELWRLKVHFRAPPDVRGSGKERGHGTELKFCPKCGKELKPGKHHVGCSAGKSAPRQAAKRQRQMSSTTESDWMSPSSTGSQEEGLSDSWEDTVRRQVNKVHREKNPEEEAGSIAQQQHGGNSVAGPSGRQGGGGGTAAAAVGESPHDMACRVSRMQQILLEGDDNAELVFTANTMADFGLILRHQGGGGGGAGGVGGAAALPGQEEGSGRSISPSPSLARILDSGDPAADVAAMPLMRAPSPPPLPPDWDMGFGLNTGFGNGGIGGGGHSSLLFDFDQFDVNRRTTLEGVAEPIMTVTSAMNPAEMSNPSDDYIWQIMFAGENELPKRVTAHLHHAPEPSTSDDFARMFEGQENPIGGGGGGGGGGGVVHADGWLDPALVAEAAAIGGTAAVVVHHNDDDSNTNGKQQQQQQHGGGGKDMHPPPSRPAAAAAVPVVVSVPAGVPPPPLELLEQPHQPQTITVTYELQPVGPSGKLEYAVKRVEPAAAAVVIDGGDCPAAPVAVAAAEVEVAAPDGGS